MKCKRILWLTRHQVKKWHTDFLDQTFKIYKIIELTYSEYRFTEEHRKAVVHIDNLIQKYQTDIVFIVAPWWMKEYIVKHTSHKDVVFMESVFSAPKSQNGVWKRFRKIQ